MVLAGKLARFAQPAPACAGQKACNIKSTGTIMQLLLFLYLWQCASYVHVCSHLVAAILCGIPARVVLAWQKLVPMIGWIWDKYQPHEAFMCHYDSEAIERAPNWQRVAVGFAGPYVQLIYMLLVGLRVPRVCSLVGGFKNYVIIMLAWTILYLPLYAIWFHEDPNSDFALFVKAETHSSAGRVGVEVGATMTRSTATARTEL